LQEARLNRLKLKQKAPLNLSWLQIATSFKMEWNMPEKTKAVISVDAIVSKIISLRGERVMLDRDLANMYGVEIRVLKQAVRRNIDRFPDDFMFELTKKEQDSLRSQFVTLKRGQHSKYPPFAFTEQGVAMLSSVLNSDHAIGVNIAIMRTFTRLRKMLVTHKDLKRKIEAMEKKYDEQFRIVFEAITQLIEEDEKPKKKIGYLKESQAEYGKGRRKN
jgi:phage regulator Rha-like protein